MVGRACFRPFITELAGAAGEAGAHVRVPECEDGAFFVDAFGDDEFEVAVLVLSDAEVRDGAEVRVELSQISAAGLSLTYAYTHAKDSAIPVKFVSAGSAPVDFTSNAWMNGLYVKNKQEAAEFVTGDKYTEEQVGPGTKGEAVLKKMSPITYLKSDSVPTLLLYGEQDYLVPTGQHKDFLKKLDKVGVYHEVFLNPYGGHLSLISEAGVKWLVRTLTWCELYFN